MESVETKGRSDLTSRVTMRQLVGIEDYEACIQLQRDTWGLEFTGCIPRNVLMIVAQEAGGVLVGAFDERRLVGFVLGMAGIRDRKPIHWSQMLAVAPDYRGSGLGRTMKLYQRERVMLQGIDVMHWTFDPLEATNAHLNFNRLGVQADRYVENMYGTDNKANWPYSAPTGACFGGNSTRNWPRTSLPGIRGRSPKAPVPRRWSTRRMMTDAHGS